MAANSVRLPLLRQRARVSRVAAPSPPVRPRRRSRITRKTLEPRDAVLPRTTARLTSTTPSPVAIQVQTFGRKKTAVAVVHCKAGKGLIKFNGACLIRLGDASYSGRGCF